MSRRHAASEHDHTRSRDCSSHRALSQYPGPMPPPRYGWLPALSSPARTQRPDLPDHAREWQHSDLQDLGSRTPASHGAACRPRSDGQHQSSWHRADRSLLSQQLCGDARRGARPLHRFLREGGPAQSSAQPAADSFVGRVGRSIADSLERKNGRHCWRTSESCSKQGLQHLLQAPFLSLEVTVPARRSRPAAARLRRQR